MVPAKALAQLALQKRFLQAESEARRLMLGSELHRATRPARWVEQWRLRARPLLLLVAPAVGFWYVRRSKGMKRWLATGLGAMRLLHGFRRFLHRPGS